MTRLLLLALATALLVACEGEEAPATPSVTPSVVATIEAARTPTTPTPVTIRPPVDRKQQVVIFDLADQSFTELLTPLVDEEDIYFATEIFPQFTPDGAHVWIGERVALASRRYDIEGGPASDVPGIRVEEHDEERLTYVRTDGDDPVVTVRLGREEYAIPAAATSGEVELSPDGEHIAYWVRDPHETVTYEIAEVRTGEIVATASEVGLCHCDRGPIPYWSPSGRYLVFSDSPSPPGNTEDLDHGTFALDAETGERILLSSTGWSGEGAALADDQFLAERDGSVVILDARSDSIVRSIAPLEDADAPFLAAGGVVAIWDIARDPYAISTRFYDIASGVLRDTRDGQWRPIAIEDGVAYQRTDEATTLVHPLLPEPHVFDEGFVLSPDGRHVAAAEGSAINIYRVEADGLEPIASYERSVNMYSLGPTIPVEWNAQSTHLLISIGFGL